MHVCNIFSVKKLANAGVYQVPDAVWFNQVQITDVPEPVLVHVWLDITLTYSPLCLYVCFLLYCSQRYLITATEPNN